MSVMRSPRGVDSITMGITESARCWRSLDFGWGTDDERPDERRHASVDRGVRPHAPAIGRRLLGALAHALATHLLLR